MDHVATKVRIKSSKLRDLLVGLLWFGFLLGVFSAVVLKSEYTREQQAVFFKHAEDTYVEIPAEEE